MGLFSWWNARKAEHQAREVGARRVAQLIEMQREDEQDEWQKVVERSMAPASERSGDLQEDSSVVNTRSEGAGWEILGSAYKGHIGRDQQIMIAEARRFFRFDPNAAASIFGLLDYLMGRGVVITPKSKDPRIWKLWRKFWTSPENNMDVRQFEIFKRIFRDGETMLRYFTKNKEGGKVPFTIVRFLDPIDIRRGTSEADDRLTDKTNQGITFDPDDAEKPITYHMQDRNDPVKEHKIPADEVQHIKFPSADMDQPRGETSLQTVMNLFTHYKQWLKNRIILNKLRTAIFAVREIDMASGSGVSQLSQALPTSGRSTSGENKKQNIRPGTMYTPPAGVKIRMESANINAGDVKEDGRNMILQMAAGTRLPEYMYGDASNANYSSTMMAESPFVKHIHFMQAYFEATVWRPMFRRVIEAAVNSGKLQAPEEEDIFADPEDAKSKELKEANDAGNSDPEKTEEGRPKSKPGAKKVEKTDAKEDAGELSAESELEIFYGCDVEWPEIIHREPKEQTEALVLARSEGWVSDKTCSETLGFDYPEEVRKQQMIEEEAERNTNPLLDGRVNDMIADAEEKMGLEQQDEEEKMADDEKKKAPLQESVVQPVVVPDVKVTVHMPKLIGTEKKVLRNQAGEVIGMTEKPIYE